jgi:hypothetical protein
VEEQDGKKILGHKNESSGNNGKEAFVIRLAFLSVTRRKPRAGSNPETTHQPFFSFAGPSGEA